MLAFKEFCKIEEENAAKRIEKAYQKVVQVVLEQLLVLKN